MTWLDKLLESSEEEVDEVIQNGIDSNDAQGIEDVNHASTDVLDSSVSADPDKLTYDDDCYSQDSEMGSEKVAGTVDASLGDTETTVASGNPTKPTTESAEMTPAELRKIYTECVSEIIAESTEEIEAKYKEKVAAAKEWRKKQLAKEKAAAKKAAQATMNEAADVNAMMDKIFSSMT